MKVELLIIGGGPAGLSSAYESVKIGVDTLLVDDGPRLGGQLIKQTHKFFGSKFEFAGTRGIEIPDLLLSEIKDCPNFKYITNATALGFYEDGAVPVIKDDKITIVYPQKIIIATGASEKNIPFKNNDIPGVYGAGAVQTLMNVNGVSPGKNALMIGAGNIGLIVSYQLMQAGTRVSAIVESASSIGGYWVHSAKVKRIGIPILTNHTILEAIGNDRVEGAIICEVDNKFNPIKKNTEKKIECDIICIATGLMPLVDLLYNAGCEMVYIPELGGDVAIRNDEMETSHKGIYIAGDSSGIEEASSAMLEGRIAGLSASYSLGYKIDSYEEKKKEIIEELDNLRMANVSLKIRKGLERLRDYKNAKP